MTKILIDLSKKHVQLIERLEPQIRKNTLWGKAGFKSDVVRLALDLLEQAEREKIPISCLIQNEYIIRPLKS